MYLFHINFGDGTDNHLGQRGLEKERQNSQEEL